METYYKVLEENKSLESTFKANITFITLTIVAYVQVILWSL